VCVLNCDPLKFWLLLNFEKKVRFTNLKNASKRICTLRVLINVFGSELSNKEDKA